MYHNQLLVLFMNVKENFCLIPLLRSIEDPITGYPIKCVVHYYYMIVYENTHPQIIDIYVILNLV